MKKATKAKWLGILSIVLVLICAFAIYCVVEANSRQETVLEQQTAYLLHVKEFGDASSYLTDEVRAYAANGDIAHYNNYWYEINTAQNREINIAALQELGLTAEEQAMVDLISSISNSLVPLEEQAMELTAAGKNQAAIDILYGSEYSEGVLQITNTISEFNNTIQNRVGNSVSIIKTIVMVFSIVCYAAVIITLLTQIVLVRFVLGELITPIVKICATLVEFSEGNLEGELDMVEDNTETGEMARAIHSFQDFQKELIADMGSLLKEMAEGNFNIRTSCEQNYKGNYASILLSLRQINRTLDATLKNIRVAAEQVDAGADQVASGAQALSQGATEQASATEELAATVDDINIHVQQAGEYANDASDKALEAGQLTDECNQEMKELVAAMSDISHSSEEIGKIIKTIEDIAFQTNILALNAAVEAARAGSAGKGFAVVADEVRNLAAKSAEASKNTAELIENSMIAVSKGAKLVDHAAGNLQTVADHASEVGTMVSKIAATSKEQSDTIEQVTTGLDQISAVVQTNSATAEESAAASQQLSSQAAVLKDLVRQFRLRDDTPATGYVTPSYTETSSDYNSYSYSDSKY